MRMTTAHAVVLAGAAIALGLWMVADAVRADRYVLGTSKGATVRLDTRTGVVKPCRLTRYKGADRIYTGIVCADIAGERLE